MRQVNKIILHCTGTDNTATVEAILRYWREILGWKNPGYHWIVRDDGTYTQLQDEEKPSNGVRFHNADSLHIAYIGGKGGKDTRSKAQEKSLYCLVKRAMVKYPNAELYGHSDFANKACPCFDVRGWFKNYIPCD